MDIVLTGLIFGLIGGSWSYHTADKKTYGLCLVPILVGVSTSIWLISFRIDYYLCLYVLAIGVLLSCLAQLDWVEKTVTDGMIIAGLIITATYHIYNGNFSDWVFGVVFGSSVSCVIYILGFILFGKKSFGTGDVTLLILIGSMFSAYQFLEIFFLNLIITITAVLCSFIATKLAPKRVPLAPSLVIAIGIQTTYPINLLSQIIQIRQSLLALL